MLFGVRPTKATFIKDHWVCALLVLPLPRRWRWLYNRCSIYTELYSNTSMSLTHIRYIIFSVYLDHSPLGYFLSFSILSLPLGAHRSSLPWILMAPANGFSRERKPAPFPNKRISLFFVFLYPLFSLFLSEPCPLFFRWI